MKYVYYIVAIVVVLSALAAYGVFDTRIEISKPYISVNDRIISEDEFNKMLKRKPSYMNKEQFAESVIERQILIQEAVRQKINQEESFRQSVENFYEQSLIKILLDRKLDSLVVDVTNADIERYEMMLKKKVVLTKIMYPTLENAQKKQKGSSEIIASDFAALSDDLKFVVMNLSVGQMSEPQGSSFGYFVYILEKIMDAENPVESFDMKKVSIFIQDKKKEKILKEWTRSIRASSQIWRKK